MASTICTVTLIYKRFVVKIIVPITTLLWYKNVPNGCKVLLGYIPCPWRNTFLSPMKLLAFTWLNHILVLRVTSSNKSFILFLFFFSFFFPSLIKELHNKKVGERRRRKYIVLMEVKVLGDKEPIDHHHRPMKVAWCMCLVNKSNPINKLSLQHLERKRKMVSSKSEKRRRQPPHVPWKAERYYTKQEPHVQEIQRPDFKKKLTLMSKLSDKIFLSKLIQVEDACCLLLGGQWSKIQKCTRQGWFRRTNRGVGQRVSRTNGSLCPWCDSLSLINRNS